MGGRLAQVLVGALVGGLVVIAPPAEATCDPATPTVTLPNPRRVQPDFEWNADYTATEVRFRSRTCADIAGTLFAPATVPDGLLPGVLVMPPSGGVADKSQLYYVARHLASNGYLALAVDPQGVGDSGVFSDPVCTTEPGYSNPSPCPGVPFQSADNWMVLAQSSLDWFLASVSNLDHARVGAVGHSMGARVASYLQDPFFDGTGATRIAAVVGLDNLSANYYGDTSASGGDTYLNDVIVGQPIPEGDRPIAISVPGLGLASDGANADPDFKKAAFSSWREAGEASGMLVFEGVAHEQFSQSAQSDEAMLRRFATYTRAWFDLWLKDDASAVDVLLAPTDQLSDTQHSAWYLPGVCETDDFRTALRTPPCPVGVTHATL
jgi:pimeloyl-ACP methyl ester carboxylesterase